jgi:hypothetical protein
MLQNIKLVGLIAFALILWGCNKAEHSISEPTKDSSAKEEGATKTSDIPLTTIRWDTTFINYGKVKESEGVVTRRYWFTNTGTNPLVIKSVKGSCGCTSAKFIEGPVAPGQKGWVDVIFDPKGREGLTKGKYATVICNTDPKAHKLSYEAEVLK